MKSVAVERGLSPVKLYLESQGCQVVELQNGDTSARGSAVMVVTGADKNLMGIQSVRENIPIITADGLTPEDVYERVQSYLH